MRFNWKNWAVQLGAPALVAVIEYAEGHAFSWSTARHAVAVGAMVFLALLQKSVLPPGGPS